MKNKNEVIKEELHNIREKVECFTLVESNFLLQEIIKKIREESIKTLEKIERIEKSLERKDCTLLDAFKCSNSIKKVELRGKNFIKEVYGLFEDVIDIKSKEIINEVLQSYINTNKLLSKGKSINIMSLDYFVEIKEIGELWDRNVENIEKRIHREILNSFIMIDEKIVKINNKFNKNKIKNELIKIEKIS